ncbi:MAG: hypothetical protein JSU72_07280 [Deltaproteobacteria bacterium]|nr:MAG: hypothetical protein JSU72_07280 [Deltaproteobacteria bacterium]
MARKKELAGLAPTLFIILSVVFLQQAQGGPSDTGATGTTRPRAIGRVVSQYGPMEGARVRLRGGDQLIVTDEQGHFTVHGPLPPWNMPMVTAGKEGWFNNGVILGRFGLVGDISLRPVFLADDPGYQFNSPEVCFDCHGKVTRIWNESKMAHTTANPKLLDMYYGTDAEGTPGQGEGYRLDNPRSNGNCATCHAPSAAAGSRWSLDLRGVLSSPRTEWEGVSCEYCHKVRRVVDDPSTPSGTTAILERQAPVRGRSILVFGPYDDVVVPPMAASYSSLYESGRFCSTCHSHLKRLGGGQTWDRKLIYSDKEWTGFGFQGDTTLPIQTTYQEWKQWQESLPAGDPNKEKKCQQCHMSWQKKLLPYDNFVVDGGARRMWGAYRSPEQIRPHHFEGGTKAQLQNALAMEMEGEIQRNELVVKVHISNTNGGHWVPTGEPMRSVLLLVEARDSDDKPLRLIRGGRLPEWVGSGDPAEGHYVGLPGAVFARVLADDKGNLNVPFWRATKIAVDNRIRPKKTVTLEFVFALDDPENEPSAEAGLIYRPVMRALARAKKWQVEDIPIVSKAW